MSALAADSFQLKGYGRLEAGCHANLVVFDAERVLDRATFEDSKQYPAGIQYVIVEGELVAEEKSVGEEKSVVEGGDQNQPGPGIAVRFSS
jgi:N-acyl-D-amino-acid deacylase